MAGNSTHIPEKTSACTRPNNVLGLPFPNALAGFAAGARSLLFAFLLLD